MIRLKNQSSNPAGTVDHFFFFRLKVKLATGTTGTDGSIKMFMKHRILILVYSRPSMIKRIEYQG